MPYTLDTNAAAGFLGLAPGTLINWRIRGDGPVYSKLGRRVVYSSRDLEDFLCQRKRQRADESSLCQSFGAKRLEEAVEQLVLEVLDPLALEAMHYAAQAHAEALDAVDVRWIGFGHHP